MAVISKAMHVGKAMALMAFGVIANLEPLATPGVVLPEITWASGLSTSETRWIGGMCFGGYAVAVPFLVSLTDRIGGRRAFAGSSLFSAEASSAFAGAPMLPDATYPAIPERLGAQRRLYMPGLKLPAERRHRH